MQSLYDNPDKELKVGGMVLMSVWELVLLRLGGLERVGAALELVKLALVVMLKAVRLKLPVVLKRAVASRILEGQRPFQAPDTDCCLATQSSCQRIWLRTRYDTILLYGGRIRRLRHHHCKTTKITSQ